MKTHGDILAALGSEYVHRDNLKIMRAVHCIRSFLSRWVLRGQGWRLRKQDSFGGIVYLFPAMRSCYCHSSKVGLKRGQSLTSGRFLCVISPLPGDFAGVSPGEHLEVEHEHGFH